MHLAPGRWRAVIARIERIVLHHTHVPGLIVCVNYRECRADVASALADHLPHAVDLFLTAEIEGYIVESCIWVVALRHGFIVVLVQSCEELLKKDGITVHGHGVLVYCNSDHERDTPWCGQLARF